MPLGTRRRRRSGQVFGILAIILLGLFFLAITVSLTIGNIISAPIVRLTNVANQIVGGDLSAQAEVESQDEIGTLSQAFNTMTSRNRRTSG